MNQFIKAFKSHTVLACSLSSCCHSLALAAENQAAAVITLPGDISVMIQGPACCDNPEDELGVAYIDEYDLVSPALCPAELADWTETAALCCSRINAAFQKFAQESTSLNSALSTEEADRIKRVWRAAQEAVDMPKGFRYTSFRENKPQNLVLSTLMYTSAGLGNTTWITKSALSCDFGEGVDDWGFEPNYSPDSESSIIEHRAGHSVSMGKNLFVETIEGNTPESRDKQAAYWLVGLLSDMVDSILRNPPARVYEYFLTDGLAELKKSDLDRMSKAGLTRLVKKGYVDPEKVLKVKPELFKVMLEKELIPPEVVARRLPNKLLWLVQHNYITPDYAVKLQPELADKLQQAGVYSVADVSEKDIKSLVEMVKSNTIKPIDAYRNNPKVLPELVEEGFVTPQEAYKLDASIVTWLLINHYIGRAEAAKVKPDIKQYLRRRHSDVDWESLDSARDDYDDEEDDEPAGWERVNTKDVQDWDGWWTEYTWWRNEDGLNVFIFGDSDVYNPTNTEWDAEIEGEAQAQEWWDDYQTEDLDSSKRLNSSRGYFNRPLNCSEDFYDDVIHYKGYSIVGNEQIGFVGIAPYGMFSPKSYKTLDEAKAAVEEDIAYIEKLGKSMNSGKKTHKGPRRLSASKSETAVRIVGERNEGDTHWFEVEGAQIGDEMKYLNQFNEILEPLGFEAESSGHSDILLVKAPETEKQAVSDAVTQFQKAITLNSSDDDYSGYGRLSDVTEDVQVTQETGPAWIVTGSFPGDELSAFTTSVIIPSEDKIDATAKYAKAFADTSHIVSWDTQIPCIQTWKEEHPNSNYPVLKTV